MSVLICPFCGTPLSREGTSFYCSGERRHCFDIAKSGYATLTRAPGTSGDDRDMVRARTAFLDTEHYRPFANAVSKALSNANTVIDAGCGDGYYSNILAENVTELYGFDLSKHACDKAAKRAKAGNTGAFFGVASVFELPIASECADAVVSLFAPIAEKEFARILKPGGLLVVGGAGRHHLYELKKAIYDTAYENEGRRDLPSDFEMISNDHISYTFECVKDELKSLFLMTPYAFKTSREDAARLDSLPQLKITADFEIFTYRKKE